MVEVQIACAGERVPSAAHLAAWANAALAGDDRALCVRVVDREEGAALNRRFRSQDHATNVLAFPAQESGILGDIALCAPVADSEAHSRGKRLADHYAHLVIHGTLHLLGMDHQTSAQAEAMEAKEVALLRQLGIADPYAEITDPSTGNTPNDSSSAADETANGANT